MMTLKTTSPSRTGADARHARPARRCACSRSAPRPARISERRKLFGAGDPADGGYVVLAGSFDSSPARATRSATSSPARHAARRTGAAHRDVAAGHRGGARDLRRHRVPRSLFSKMLEGYPDTRGAHARHHDRRAPASGRSELRQRARHVRCPRRNARAVRAQRKITPPASPSPARGPTGASSRAIRAES